MQRLLSLLCLTAFLSACPSPGGSDAGEPSVVDAGKPSGSDAGEPADADSGPGEPDGGSDAGVPGADGGSDAGVPGADGGADAGSLGSDGGAVCAAPCGDGCCGEGARCCEAASLGLPEDVCVPANEACPLGCPDGEGACPIGAYCLLGAEPGCVEQCEPLQRCGFNGCCPSGAACVDGACQLPDLVLGSSLGSLDVTTRVYASDACEVGGCAGAAGERLITPLEVSLSNVGAGDLLLGLPSAGAFTDDVCTGERVLEQWLTWQLVDAEQQVVATGALDVECVADGSSIDGDGMAPQMSCAFQGLTAGFVADGDALGGCGGIDVTDVAPGDYTLELTVNGDGRFAESDTGNNTVAVAFSRPEVLCDGTVCGGSCCPSGYACVDDICRLPDLTVDQEVLASSLSLDMETFAAGDCAIEEGCIAGSGDRRLLRFSTSTPNIGLADFHVGDPAESEHVEFSQCHQHYHYHRYANYRLLDENGNVAAVGSKQAFCLMDVQRVDPEAGPPQYSCDNQGVSAGWTDIYHSALDCQWIDVTGVPAGTYTVEIEVNPDQLIPEMDYGNNIATATFEIPEDPNACVPMSEICHDGVDQDCDGVPDNDCPPITDADTCEGAFVLSGPGVFSAEIGAQSATTFSPSCGAAVGGQAVFQLNLTTDQIAYFSTYGSSLDTVLAVYEGDTCGTETACADDGCGAVQEHFSGLLPAGLYTIVVKAKQADATGLVQLKVDLGGGCTDASLIPTSGTYPGTFAGQPDEKLASCRIGAGTVSTPDQTFWFTTCPGSTMVNAHTCVGPYPDTVLEIREGACRGAVPDGACNDDGNQCPGNSYASRVSTSLEGDGLWFLVVDAYSSNETSDYGLSIDFASGAP